MTLTLPNNSMSLSVRPPSADIAIVPCEMEIRTNMPHISLGSQSGWTMIQAMDGGTFDPWNTGFAMDGGSFWSGGDDIFGGYFDHIEPDIRIAMQLRIGG